MLDIKKLLIKILQWINNPTITCNTTGSTSIFYRVVSNWTDSNNSGTTTVGLGVGTNGLRHGVWSNNLQKWIIYADSSTNKIYINGTPAQGGLNVTTAAEARTSIQAAAASEIPTTSTISINTTTATGTYVSSSCHRYGNVVHLTFNFRNTSSVASGSNIYSGTLNTALPAPSSTVTSATFYGSHALVGTLNTSRVLTIRNASTTAVQYGASDTGTISFTYICS